MSGYIYAFSCESMPCIYKIGMTSRTVEERLKEANSSDTFRPPHPYKIFAYVKCEDFEEKEKIIHTLLRHERINPRKEFFRMDNKTILDIFTLIGKPVRPDVETYESKNVEDEDVIPDIFKKEEDETVTLKGIFKPQDPIEYLDEFLDACSIKPNIVKDNITLAPTELEFLRTDYVLWCQKNKGDYRPCLFGEDGRKIRDHMIKRQRECEYGLAMGEEWCVNGTPDNPRFNFVYDQGCMKLEELEKKAEMKRKEFWSEVKWDNPNYTEDGEDHGFAD